jgi:hypothetical protein
LLGTNGKPIMAIALVQQAAAHATASSTVLAIPVSALTAGNFLVVAQTCGNTSGPRTPTAPSNAEWIARLESSTTSDIFVFWIGRIITGGGTSVTLGQTISSAIVGIATEWSAPNGLLIDVTKSVNGTVTAVSSGNSPATSFANELWIGGTSFRNDTISAQKIGNATPDNSYSDVTTYLATTTDRGCSLAYDLVSSTGTPTPGYSATLNQVSQWNSVFMALREGAAPGGLSAGGLF